MQDTGPDHRLDPGRPEHFVPGDEAEAGAIAGDRPGRPGGRARAWAHRRPAGQFRLRLHLAEALRAARRSRPTASSIGCAASSRAWRARGCSCSPVSDLRTGGRQSNATYQYTLLSDDSTELYKWAPRLTEALQGSDVLKDVNSDQQQGGLQADVDDRPRDGDAPRPDAQRDRQHALRRLRPAAGLDDLQRAQSISRRDGGGAALLAGSLDAARHLCLDLGRQSDAARRSTNLERRQFQRRRRSSQLERGDDRGGFGAQPRHQLARRQRPFQRLVGFGGFDLGGDDGSVLGVRAIRARATRRSASIIRASSPPRRSRSTSRRAMR